MKRLIALLMTLALLLGTCAFAAEEEKAVAPTVKFNSSFYLGYLNQEVNITVSCTNKNSVTVPEKYLELRNHRGEVLERAFWRNPRTSLTFSVYVTEECWAQTACPCGMTAWKSARATPTPPSPTRSFPASSSWNRLSRPLRP